MRAHAARLLEIGFAISVLTAPTAFAGTDRMMVDQASTASTVLASPMRVAQNQPTVTQVQPTVTPTQPAIPQDQPAGQDQSGLPPNAAPQAGIAPPGPSQIGMPGAPGQGQQPGAPAPSAEIPKPFHGSMSFEAGSGKILTLTLPAANIYVADPKVAEVRPASSTSLFVFGVGAGHTTIAAVDVLGRLLADYEITVRPGAFGAREAQAAISRLIPGSRVVVKPSGRGMMLTGAVANASDAAQAMMIAKGYATTDATPVENQITIASPTQVTLMVRIAEMKRSTARNLGINWSAQGLFGRVAPLVPGAGPLTHLVQATLNNTTCTTGRLCFDAILNAMANEGLAHILAEPNLTVMSGQPASFQAGGEYPYAMPGGSANPNAVTIAFKPYGVLLSCVPTVLSNGRINLHVKPEVSQLDSTNTVQIPGGGIVDGLLVRRAETTVELGSGEAIAIAGMLQTTSNDNGSGLPGLGDTPVLGALFKSNSMTREQTELVIVVTPLIVQPVQNIAQLKMPGEDYKVPGDVDRLLLMKQVPNANGTTSARTAGAAGFIVR